MKISELKQPSEGNLTPEDHKLQKQTILTDRIAKDLCAQRQSLEAIVPLMSDLKTIAQTNNEVSFQLLDQIRQAREEANANTTKVVEAVEKLISELSRRQ